MRLYYMTSAKWAETILKERRIKLSRFSEANDPFELRLIDSRDHNTRNYADLIYNYFDKNVGFICFGATWESPIMWAHYAEKHTGVALGFDVEPEGLIAKINYTDEKIQVPFGSHLPKHGLTEELLTQIQTTKSTDWAYENEYRVVTHLDVKDSTTGCYYTDFGAQIQLRELILGHRCSWTKLKALDLVGVTNLSIRIFKVRPAFGKFKMVEQQLFKSVLVKPRNA